MGARRKVAVVAAGTLVGGAVVLLAGPLPAAHAGTIAVADDGYAAHADHALVVAAPGVLANDGAGLSATAASAPAHGQVTLRPDGSFTYTPNGGFRGADSFTYTASDGTSTSAPAKVAIAVGPNHAPTAQPDHYLVFGTQVLHIGPAAGVLANDADPDGDAIHADLTKAPGSGVVQLFGTGGFSFSAPRGFNGTRFTYRADDGAATSAARTVTLVSATQTQRLVDAAYLQILGREADAGGLAYWTGRLDGGLPAGSFTAGVDFSPEANAHTAQVIYTSLLGREPDAAGAAFFTSELAHGGTVQALQAQVMGSAEYLADAGGTTHGFLTAVYTQLVGRTVDPGGESYWSSRLAAGTSRETVVAAVTATQEQRLAEADRLYERAFGRHVDPAGGAYWAGRLATDDIRVVADALLGTPEYDATVQAADEQPAPDA